MNILNNKIDLLEEEIYSIHKYLDDLNISRVDDNLNTYSIVGRINQLKLTYLKQLSNLETNTKPSMN